MVRKRSTTLPVPLSAEFTKPLCGHVSDWNISSCYASVKMGSIVVTMLYSTGASLYGPAWRAEKEISAPFSNIALLAIVSIMFSSLKCLVNSFPMSSFHSPSKTRTQSTVDCSPRWMTVLVQSGPCALAAKIRKRSFWHKTMMTLGLQRFCKTVLTRVNRKRTMNFASQTPILP